MSAPRPSADAARARIAGEMMGRRPPPRERYDDIERHARPGERPHPRAQWDEVHGCWIEWDDDDVRWELVGTDEPVGRVDPRRRDADRASGQDAGDR